MADGYGTAAGHHGPAADAFDNSIGAEDDLLRHGGIADAEEQNVGVFRDFLRGGAELAFFGVGEFLGLGRGVGPDGDFVSGAEEVAGHGVPHESESEKS